MFPPSSPSTAAVNSRAIVFIFDCFFYLCLTGVPDQLIAVSSESSELLFTPFFGSAFEDLELFAAEIALLKI